MDSTVAVLARWRRGGSNNALAYHRQGLRYERLGANSSPCCRCDAWCKALPRAPVAISHTPRYGLQADSFFETHRFGTAMSSRFNVLEFNILNDTCGND